MSGAPPQPTTPTSPTTPSCQPTCPPPSNTATDLFLATMTSILALQCEIGDNTIYPPKATLLTEYDFIIVGTGASGCLLASKLSSIRGSNILLLEAGRDPPYTSEIPALTDTLVNSDIDWKLLSDGKGDYCKGMNDHKCNLAMGKVLGGGSTLTTEPYFRGHPKDYERWERDGIKGWNYKTLLPFFEKAEGKDKGGHSSEESRSDSREEDEAHLSLEPFQGGELPLLKNLRRAVLERGHRVHEHPQKICHRGFFNTYGLLKDGVKSSAAKAFLPSLKTRPNVHLVRNATVRKINFTPRRTVQSIEFDIQGSPHTVIVKKEIILSGGAINTPKILMLSGIGPKKHLNELKIPVVADLPVGKHLQDHILFPGVVASINRGSDFEDLKSKTMRDVADYLIDRKGALSGIGLRQFVGFLGTRNSKEPSYPDIEIEFAYVNKGDLDFLRVQLAAYNYNLDVATEFTNLVNDSSILLAFPTLMHPKSMGRVQLSSTDPSDPPQITLNYFSDPDDEETMLWGIAEAMKILKTKALHKLRVEPRALLEDCLTEGKERGRPSKHGHIDDSPVMSKRYWRCALRIVTISAKHRVGTCRMGPSHKDSVVDHHLRVHHVKGLRVADSSVMPYITTGGINGAEAAIAAKAARMIMEHWMLH